MNNSSHKKHSVRRLRRTNLQIITEEGRDESAILFLHIYKSTKAHIKIPLTLQLVKHYTCKRQFAIFRIRDAVCRK